MTTTIADELGRIPMSPFLTATLTRAAETATAQSHREVTLEHLLLALTEDPEASVVLKSSNVDLSRLTAEVSAALAENSDHRGSDQAHVTLSNDLRRILEAAAAAAQQGRRREINGAIVLAAIVGDAKSRAAELLRAQGLTFEAAIRALQRATQAPSPSPSPSPSPPTGSQHAQPASVPQAKPPGEPRAPEPRASAPQPMPSAVQPTDEGGHAHERVGQSSAAPRSPSHPVHQGHVVGSGAGEMASKDAGQGGFQHTASPAQPYQQPAPAAPRMERPQGPPHGQQQAHPQQPPAAAGPNGQGGYAARPTAQSHQGQQPAPPQSAPPANVNPSAQQWVPPREAGGEAGSYQNNGPIAQPSPRPQQPRAPQMGNAQSPIMAPQASRYGNVQPQQPMPGPAGGGAYQGGGGGPRSAQVTPPAPAWNEASDPRRGPAHGGHYGANAGLGSATLQIPNQDRRRGASAPASDPNAYAGHRPMFEAGQIVENIPRRMRVAIPVVVEARIARADVFALSEGMQGGGTAYRHDVIVTKAMSVRLRAPEGGFWIEARSPETQWIEAVLGLQADDFASWRWTVTARERGRRQLQLIVSTRTVGADGLAAETALPDQVVDVRIGINYGATFGRLFGWLVIAAIGGVVARFGEQGFELARILIMQYLNR